MIEVVKYLLPWTILFFLSAAASANIFVKDDRTQVGDKSIVPFSSIGRLVNTVDGSAGTAFLVSRCHILTNYHVAFSNEKVPDPHEISRFTLDLESTSKAIPVLYGKFYDGEKFNNLEDWAILKLENCLGDSHGWLQLSVFELSEVAKLSAPLAMAGYPQDRDAKFLTLDPECRVYAQEKIGSPGWRHDCASREGTSGSPIMANLDGHIVVVALNSVERGNFAEIIKFYATAMGNGSVPVDAILPHIESVLRSDQR